MLAAIRSTFASANARTLGRSGAWTLGRSDARAFGRSDAWAFGCPGVRTPGSGHLDVRTSERPDARTLRCLSSSFFNFCVCRGGGPPTVPSDQEPPRGPRRDECQNCEKQTQKRTIQKSINGASRKIPPRNFANGVCDGRKGCLWRKVFVEKSITNFRFWPFLYARSR